ncbi:MAG: thermonuclease family protein [Ignavibacteriaceae bacterium]
MKKNFEPKAHPLLAELFIVIILLFNNVLDAQSFTIPKEHYYYQACLRQSEDSNSILFIKPTLASDRQVKVKVARVIDGDTFVLSDSTHVRLLGVNTPELHKTNIEDTLFADSAVHFLKMLIGGKTIKLTFDRGLYGIFGRLLAYAWLIDIHDKDSLFVQAELLKAGLARIFYYPKGMKYYYIFQNLKRTARRKRMGIWGIR